MSNKPDKLLLLFKLLFCGSFSVNANLFSAVLHRLKLNNAISESEKCIVLTNAYVCAGVNFGAALTNKNVACKNELTVCTLYAQTL